MFENKCVCYCMPQNTLFDIISWLSYAVWSVRVGDISEQNLVPSISMSSNNNHELVLPNLYVSVQSLRYYIL